MNIPKEIRIDEYDYPLPEDKIAFFPKEERDSSKLLVYNNEIKEDLFKSVASYLPENSILIYNNSKVIAARLFFTNSNGALIEIFCLEPHQQSLEDAMRSKNSTQWVCLIGNAKKFKEEKLILKNDSLEITAFKKETLPDGKYIVEFNWNSDNSFGIILEKIGKIPLPPYIKRAADSNDAETYQTIFSKIEGSVASSTSGLHFTPNVFEELKTKGIESHSITLHIGAGTFMPVKSEKIGDHTIHQEEITVSKSFIEFLKENKKFITCVGTTSVRSIESIYWLGVLLKKEKHFNSDIIVPQWTAYENQENISIEDSLNNILDYLSNSNLNQLRFKSQIIIAPGYEFKFVNALITNFHQPKSTLLLLVSAFIGQDWKEVYEYALANNFRFLSYGDSSLLFRKS